MEMRIFPLANLAIWDERFAANTPRPEVRARVAKVQKGLLVAGFRPNAL